MARISHPRLAILFALLIPGCGFPGWYRSIGSFPGVAPSDYAFYNFCGTSSQVYQFSVDQVHSASLEALRDLGFREIGPAETGADGVLTMKTQTPDGRTAIITFTPQNRMTNMRIDIGPFHHGDESFCRDIHRRVAVNFGTLPRDYIPVETTIPHRSHPPTAYPPQLAGPAIETLEGEGLRPGEEPAGTQLEFTAPVTGTGSGVIPQPFDPLRPYYGGQGYPSTPFYPMGPLPGYFNNPGAPVVPNDWIP